MKLTVNGCDFDLPQGEAVDGLVARLGFAGQAVAVEVNKELVSKRQHPTTPLVEGDVVEVVTLVGGG